MEYCCYCAVSHHNVNPPQFVTDGFSLQVHDGVKHGEYCLNRVTQPPTIGLKIRIQVLAASRQTFAFSRDGALPFSSILYRMNGYTKTPVNTVWFCCILSTLLGLLVFAGEQAIGAVFVLSVVGLYVAYAIPIAARFIFENDYKPGPFDLGRWVSWRLTHRLTRIKLFPESPGGCDLRDVDGVYGGRVLIPCDPGGCGWRHELRRSCPRRSSHPLAGLLLFPQIWWEELVHGTHSDGRWRS